jgi:hypothetical protein
MNTSAAGRSCSPVRTTAVPLRQENEMDDEQTQQPHDSQSAEAVPDANKDPAGADGLQQTPPGEADNPTEEESGEDAPMGTHEDEAFDPVASGRRLMNPANAQVLGVLMIEFPERSVSVLADGDAAMRVLEAHRRGSRFHEDLGCPLDPYLSSAENGWFTLDPSEALLISWMPGLPAARRRMAVDPAIPSTAD